MNVPANQAAADAAGEQPPSDMPPPPDSAKWDQAAEQFRIDLLSKVQASAAVWSGAIATLLGLFGSVALVAGPADISKIGGPTKAVVVVLTLLAGLTAAIALVLAAIAQQLPSVHSNNWNGAAYQAYVIGNADAVASKARVARILGVIAAGLVFATGMTALIYGAVH